MRRERRNDIYLGVYQQTAARRFSAARFFLPETYGKKLIAVQCVKV